MAAPTLVAATETDGNGGSTSAVTWAAGNASDTIVIIYGVFAMGGIVTPSMTGFTVPTGGFTNGSGGGSSGLAVGVLLKAAGTTSGGSGTLNLANANGGQADWLSFRVAGGDTTNLYDIAAGCVAAMGSGATLSVAALTASGVDRLGIIVAFGAGASITGFTGFTNSVQWSGSSAEGAWLKAIAASGSTGTFSGTQTANPWGTVFVLIPPATSSGVTGTAAVTLAAATSAAAGTEKIVGTAPVALAAATSSASGTEKIVGTAAVALANAVAAASGPGTNSGTVAVTLAAATSSATGSERFTGSGAATLGAATAAGLGKNTGTAAVTLAPAIVAASQANVIMWTASQADGPATDFGTAGAVHDIEVVGGKYSTNGYGTNVNNGALGISTATIPFSLAGGMQLDADVNATTATGATNGRVEMYVVTAAGYGYSLLCANAWHIYPIIAGVRQTALSNVGRSTRQEHTTWTWEPNGDMKVYADGVLVVGVNDTSTTPGNKLYLNLIDIDAPPEATIDNIVIKDVVTGPPTPTGTVAVTLGTATAAAAGSQKIVGTGAATLAAATVSASGGTPPVTGTAAVTLGAATSAAAGSQKFAGTGAATLGAATSTAAGTEKVVGTAAVTLGAATVVAGGKNTGTVAVTLAAVTAVAAGTERATWLPSDEFTGSVIDYAQWDVYNRIGDLVNSEVNGVIPANVRVGSGTLKIDSKFEDITIGDSETAPQLVHYTSGQIAQRSAPFLYGDVQVRAKIPGGIGLWPCIWMLGFEWQASQPFTANTPGHDWPNDGWWECDIAEFMYGHRTQVNNALHFISPGRNGSGEYTIPFDATTRFMVYRLVWTATSMRWYVDAEDGVGWRALCVMTGVAGVDIPDTPGYLIIHTAIGGSVGGTPDSSTFPQTMEVDWARVTATAQAGTGNATLANATSSAAGSQKFTGAGAAALGAATSAATGTIKVNGSAAPVLADATSAAAGGERIAGTAAAVLGAATASASGGTPPVTGTAAVTLAAATSSAAGTTKVAGQAAPTLADATSTAAGTERIAGTAAPVLGAAVAYAAGGNLPITGTAAPVLADATSTANGSERISGAGTAALGAATSAAVGVERYVGAVAIILTAATALAVGSSGNAGSGSATLGAATANAVGVERIRGTVAAILAAAYSTTSPAASLGSPGSSSGSFRPLVTTSGRLRT